MVEDIFARLWELWDTFEAMPRPQYLFRSARNLAVDQLRRRKLIDWHSLDVPPAGCERDEPGAWAIDPRDRYAQVDQHLDLAAALGLLTARERTAFITFYVRGQSSAGTSRESADKMRRQRARQRLARSQPLAGYDGWQAVPAPKRVNCRRPGAQAAPATARTARTARPYAQTMQAWPRAVLTLLAAAATPDRIIEQVIAGAIPATAEAIQAAMGYAS